MSRTCADILIEPLADWGVEVVFGLPGDGINGIMEALRTHQNKVRFVQVRHEEAAACELRPIDYAAVARACGGKGFRIEEPGECGEILDEALNERGPVVIDAVVDPYEPPMPPKVSVSQAAKLAEALAKGTPNRKRIAFTILSDKVREVI